MMDGKPYRLCWKRDQAGRILATEALEGDDAIFLATHSPITGFDIVGRGAADITSAHEDAVLAAMSDPERRHAFCVVQGEPGSGKSHLIRWMSVNWPRGKDVKLLLRRADGSLEGALRQLRERLPAEFHTLFEGLGVRQKATLQGRANNFLSWLANTLDPDHYDDKIGDETWCERHRPGDILSHAKIKQGWQAPTRILRLLEGAGGERNSATASFNLYDVAELGPLAASVRHTFGAAAKDLARRLGQEGEAIAEYREAGWLPDDLATEHKDEFPYTIGLAGALDRRRNDAIQNVLGVSAAGLKTLFRRIRQQLKSEGHRLVLLLEDITSWEGLDDSLIDVLTFNSEASGGETEADVCPLISVVGLTPAYFDKLQGNYKQRITHDIRLGQSTGHLQDVASLREESERVDFITRYLAAVRAGETRLRAWREDLRDLPAQPPPNVCESCEKRDPCHTIFGHNDGVGLFPLNPTALDRFFDALKADDNGQTWRTPRGILQAVLSPCLAQPELLEEGQYPGRIIESGALERARLPENAISDRLNAILSARIDDDDERARFRRMVSFWGDPESADTRQVGDTVEFAGMSQALVEAFDLTWLGSAAPATAIPAAPTQPVDPSATSVDTAGDAAAAQGQSQAADGEQTGIEKVIRRKEPRDAKVAPPSRNKRTQSVRETMREELRAWAGGGGLGNQNRWNDLLFELIAALDPRTLGVTPFIFGKVVTRDMVKLQGSTAAIRQYLVVPPEDWVRAGLEGVLDLELRRDMSPGDKAFAYRNISLMMRRLHTLIAAYLRRRLPLSTDGEIWSPIPAMAQVLQARAWLRGSAAPDASVLDQIRAILSDEDEALTDPASRSAPWMEWLNATRSWHERIRGELRASISLALEGGGAGAALVDASEVAGAISRMRARGMMDEAPKENGHLPDGMAKARELVEQWGPARTRIVQIEFGQVKGRVQNLGGLLRNRTISAHLERLDNAIKATSALLPNASADQVALWVREHQRVLPRLSAELSAVEDLIIEFDDESTIPAMMPLRLKWLSLRPARALDEALTLANLGEKTVAALHDHARDCVQDGNRAGSLEAIKAVGRRLQQASETAENKAKDAA